MQFFLIIIHILVVTRKQEGRVLHLSKKTKEYADFDRILQVGFLRLKIRYTISDKLVEKNS